MSRIERILSPPLSILLSVIIGGIVIWIAGYSPIEAYSALLKGAFGTTRFFLTTLERSTPLILCGLAAAVALKSGMFNIGAEGQLFLGALGYSLAALYLPPMPTVIHILICCLFAAIFGGIWILPIILIKLKNGTHEVVTSIMMNYIARLLIAFLAAGPMMMPGDIEHSYPFPQSARIGELFIGSRVTGAFAIAIVICLGMWVLMSHTTKGFEITAAGMNARAAEAGGINPTKVRIGSTIFSGMLAGLAGGLIVASSFGRLIQVVSTGYGFEGISVAVLGQYHPIGILLASILFGALRTGGLYMEMFVGIPEELKSILQGVMIVVIASPLLLKLAFNYVAERRRKNG